MWPVVGIWIIFWALLASGIQGLDCSLEQKRFDAIVKSGKATDVFYFMNDTKETIQLTWVGENSGVLILVTMTEGDSGPGLTSDIYRSDNNGKVFFKITHDLGEQVYIRRENGLQRHQNQRDSKELFVICYDVENKHHSIIFVTKDGGFTWEKSNVPFVLSGQLRFYPRKRLSPWILTLEEKTSRLYLSLNNGKSWVNVHDNVADFFWSIYDSDPDETFYVLHRPNSSKNDSKVHTLSKTTDFGKSWTVIMKNVIRVWAPRGVRTQNVTNGTRDSEDGWVTRTNETDRGSRFLYIAHYVGSENQTTQLSLSTDGGKSFHSVYLPTVHPERFYSVLEVEDDLAFVHVDAPNDTGYGTLFTSDITGRIFTESLRQHLYPNHAPVTDFYRVASMRGTYLATRLNPDRTLHTVITHNRGASWRALGPPLNAADLCKNDQSTSESKPPTPISTTFSKQSADKASDLSGNSTDSFRPASDGLWETESDSNDTLSIDPSAIKVCGLQISNQFSIRNRVIASPPLSIAAAPGLILAHGHVATHLKNTPADVFVSSDGGYTWLKALDGPHHYQIANRGGLLVAVPADTLWPDVLRFSTDEGKCWHTIPLRAGLWKTDSRNSTPAVTVHTYETSSPPTSLSSEQRNLSTTPASFSGKENNGTMNMSSTEPAVPNYEAMSRSRADETVVFTGLVTEPGGRAMAAAVYGYGAVSQRWRVAVVDFRTNGMVTRTCTEDDYEVWTPHSSTDGLVDGCLLGMRERYKRLKKDSVCVNEYGMESLLATETCECTLADFECEYGFYRRIGSLDCIRNPHIPFLDPCLLPKQEREHTHRLGYRLIPGDRCVGGWKPPIWNQTVVQKARQCLDESPSFNSERSGLSISIIGILLVLLSVGVVILGVLCHRRRRITFDYSNDSARPMTSSLSDRLRHALTPSLWKRSASSTVPLHFSYADNHNNVWPPVASTRNLSFQYPNSNGTRGLESVTVTSGGGGGGGGAGGGGLMTSQSRIKPLSAGQFTSMRPTFMSRFRQNQNGSDVSNLLDEEEIACATEPAPQPVSTDSDSVLFQDPLSSPVEKNTNSSIKN
ncbi:unnamed protein product [Calicophoron daubneyi]|uniref:VPS10 domain-containing protein n=1 Tax=Calicophoron daubneyi TaxID=300641 RepID=A0AAV2T0R2_CALDB